MNKIRKIARRFAQSGCLRLSAFAKKGGPQAGRLWRFKGGGGFLLICVCLLGALFVFTPSGRSTAENFSFRTTQTVAPNQTFSDVFSSQHIEDGGFIRAFVNSLEAEPDYKNLRAGQEITFVWKSRQRDFSPDNLARVLLPSARIKGQILEVTAAGPEAFTAYHKDEATAARLFLADGIIKSSLYETAMDIGLPYNILSDFVDMYSWQVDFQREVQPADSFRILYTAYVDEKGAIVRAGHIQYAAFHFMGKDLVFYAYLQKDGRRIYYDENGIAASRGLLRTPVKATRISSGFGLRYHPILGYSRMHQGIDFAAPTGTPIHAAGTGRIVARSVSKSYGLHIVIAHSGGIQTLYGHMSRYDLRYHVGSTVHQGDVIGYVGATGMATGPHLHYGISVGGRFVNPKTVSAPPPAPLDRRLRAVFEIQKQAILSEAPTARLQNRDRSL